MATGIARGAWKRGRRVAFGDGKAIRWDHQSHEIFRGNPNIARPDERHDADRIEWADFYKGHRIYNTLGPQGGRWIWNYDFKAKPGEVFLDPGERTFVQRYGRGFIVMEPDVPAHKRHVVNKDWGRERYQIVATALVKAGYDVVSFVHRRDQLGPLGGVRPISTVNFRQALAVMERAALYIGAEGGLHHGAAALGKPGVVIFGGWVPPEVLGYDTHTNITGGTPSGTSCGFLQPCTHCRAILAGISPDEVIAAAMSHLRRSV